MEGADKVKTDEVSEEKITAYKGFDKNLQCRGYQFAVGETYKHKGKVEVCASGFHSCENPLDVWSYYDIGGENRFAVVTASGSISRHDGDSKIASASIRIEAELKLPEIVSAAIAWVKKACEFTGDTIASGDFNQLASSGYSSKLASSGNSSQLASSGNYSQLASSGHSSKLTSSGKKSIVMAAAPNCTAKAGDDGAIALTWWVESEERYRISVAYVGENGIKPNVYYRLDKDGNFTESN